MQGKKLSRSEKQKIQAVALNNPTNISQAARDAGVPRQTYVDEVRELEKDEEFLKLREQYIREHNELTIQAAKLAAKLSVKKMEMLENDNELLCSAQLRDIAGAAETLTKTNQLLNNKPTEIVSGDVKVAKLEDWFTDAKQ